MIQTIVFDMGGVLIAWDPPMLVKQLGLAPDEEKLILREVFGSAEWAMQDRGVVPPEEIIKRMCKRLPEKLHAAAAQCVNGWWEFPFSPIPGIDALLQELHTNGYTLYVLSNASRALHGYFPRLPGADVFSGHVVSADWGILKPDRALSRILLDSFDLNPEECYFVDDNPLNVEAAMTLGMQGSVFDQDVTRLRKELKEASVRVAL